MTVLTEVLPHAGGFLISEANGDLSREVVTLDTGDLTAGTVLGKITVGAASATAVAGNTGNGTVGTITVSAGAKPGIYKLTIIEPGTNVGAFMVEDPDGITIGNGDVAAAFAAGGLSFTLADGSTDFAAGDQIDITVAAGSGKYVQFNQDATNGSQYARAILYSSADATDADVEVAVIARLATVTAAELVWPADIEAGEITAALADLAAFDIIAR